MITIEIVTIWAAIFFITLSSLLYLTAIFFHKDRLLKVAKYLAWTALLSQTVSIAVRWISIGHPPVYGIYEHVLLASWATVLVFLLVIRSFPRLEILGAGPITFALLMIGYGIMSGTKHEALAAQYKSNWIWVHVGFGWLAYGAFTMSAVVAGAYLIKEKASRSKEIEPDSFLSKLPELSALDDLILRFVALGFIGETGMIATGSIWASSLWGSYWSWEPLQTWSLASWLIYGIFIHLRVTMGWRGRRAAWLSLIALSSAMFIYWGISLVSDVHTRIL